MWYYIDPAIIKLHAPCMFKQLQLNKNELLGMLGSVVSRKRDQNDIVKKFKGENEAGNKVLGKKTMELLKLSFTGNK